MPAVRRSKSVRDIPVKSELADLLKTIQKKHGQNTILRGTEQRQPFRIPTGIFTLDYATLGGVPHNRFTMAHGKKHSGKSTGAFKSIAGAQRSMPTQQAVLVDIEGTYDMVWGGKNGIDNDALILVQPDNGEQAVDIMVAMCHARETSLIVVDSIGAMLPFKEGEMSAEDSAIPGLQAKLITSMCRKLGAAMIEERKRGHFVSFFLINQERKKIGGWSPAGADAISLPGGDAVGFFTSLELKFKNKSVTKTEDAMVVKDVNEHSFVVEKNKMNSGMMQGEYRMLCRPDEDLGLLEGEIDDAGTMLVFAKRLGWWTGTPKAGYVLEIVDFDEKFTDAEEAIRYLYQNREVYESLRTQLIVNNAINLGMPQDFVDYLQGV